MIYTLTVNPALDLRLTLPDLKIGTLNRTESEELRPGGKGINVSLALKQLGVVSKAIVLTAGRTGALLEALLIDADVAAEPIRQTEGMTRINAKASAAGEDTELNGPGPALTAETVKALKAKLSVLTEEDTLIISGSVPQGADPALYCHLFDVTPACRVIADTAGPALKAALALHPFLIKPNLSEYADLVGAEVKSAADVIQTASQARTMGARSVLVSLGADGAVLIPEHGRPLQLTAPSGQTVCTVGAGDALLSGFIYGLEKKAPLPEALSLGVAVGSLTAFTGQFPDAAAAEALAATLTPQTL